MLAELRSKAQVTIPKELVDRLGLSEGDKFDVFENNGTICFMPVAVYPKQVLAELREEIKETKNQIASGKQPIFSNIDALFDKLDGKS